jgi:hypothetical protein
MLAAEPELVIWLALMALAVGLSFTASRGW